MANIMSGRENSDNNERSGILIFCLESCQIKKSSKRLVDDHLGELVGRTTQDHGVLSLESGWVEIMSSKTENITSQSKLVQIRS